MKVAWNKDINRVSYNHRKCGTCNMGIGCLKDNVTMLKKAISYLEDS